MVVLQPKTCRVCSDTNSSSLSDFYVEDPRTPFNIASPQIHITKRDITEKRNPPPPAAPLLEVIRAGVVSAVACVPNTSKRDVFTHTQRGSQPAKQIINKVREIN